MRLALCLLCLGPRKKSHGQEATETGDGTRGLWVTRRVGGISPERANKQTPAGEVGVMEKGERGHRVCRDSGSGGVPRVLREGRESAGVGSRSPALGGAPEPGSAEPGGWGPRAEAGGGGSGGPGRLNKAGARGLATHNKKLMSAAARAAGRWSRGLGRGGPGGRGKERKARRRGAGQRRGFRGRNLLGSASPSGTQRGRKCGALGRRRSMGGEGKGGGERALACPDNSHRGRRSATPRLLLAADSCPHPAKSRESDARPLRPSNRGPGRFGSGRVCRAPRGRSGGAGG